MTCLSWRPGAATVEDVTTCVNLCDAAVTCVTWSHTLLILCLGFLNFNRTLKFKLTFTSFFGLCWTRNDGPILTAPSKTQWWKTQYWEMRNQNTGVENAEMENMRLFFTLHFCRLTEPRPILQSLWRAGKGFFGNNSPNLNRFGQNYTVFQKTSTHIICYKLRNNCLILTIFGTKIDHIIWHRMTAYLSTSPN